MGVFDSIDIEKARRTSNIFDERSKSCGQLFMIAWTKLTNPTSNSNVEDVMNAFEKSVNDANTERLLMARSVDYPVGKSSRIKNKVWDFIYQHQHVNLLIFVTKLMLPLQLLITRDFLQAGRLSKLMVLTLGSSGGMSVPKKSSTLNWKEREGQRRPRCQSQLPQSKILQPWR